MIFIAIAPDYSEMRIHFCGPHTSYHAANKAMQNSINNGDIPVGLQFLVMGINERRHFMIESVVIDTTRFNGDNNLLTPPAPMPPVVQPPLAPKRINMPSRFQPDYKDPEENQPGA